MRRGEEERIGEKDRNRGKDEKRERRNGWMDELLKRDM